MIDAATTLSKVDTPGITALSTATTSLSPKPLNTAGFYPVANSLVDNSDTYVKDSNSVIAKPLDTLQLPNNNHLIV